MGDAPAMALEAHPTVADPPPFRPSLDLITHGLPEELLPSGGSPQPCVPGPVGSLAEDTLALLHALRSTRRPARWLAPAFVAEVALVRAHLVPILDRGTLSSSFEREAFHPPSQTSSTTAARMSATRIAYAIRWLELGDGEPRPAWTALLESGTP